MRYIGYNERGFQKLKAGDVVVYEIGLKKRRTVCTGNNDIWVQAHDEKENNHAAE